MTDYPESSARFARETANHELTILRDNGLYRHLRFAAHKGSTHWFDIVTWPNNLMIRGDGPNYMFSVYPTVDMFQLFRESAHCGINPGYWQEKVVAGQVKSWSEEKFRAWVANKAASAESRHPGLVEAVDRQILHSDEHNTEYEETARYAVASFSHDDYQLRIPEKWELDFDDYSWEYLWGCHAIVWGITRYGATQQQGMAR